VNTTTLAITYTHHDGNWFHVSTINRNSSSPLAPDMVYAETIVWECDENTGTRGNMVWQGSCAHGSLVTHNATVDRIRATGSPEQPEHDS